MDQDRVVRVGMRVRDLDGKDLGRITRCDEWGFEIEKGFFQPREAVARYDEVHDIQGDTVVLARSDRELFELAAGAVPRTWRTPDARDGFPSAATPAEAHALEEARAAALRPAARFTASAPAAEPVPTPEEEREFVETRGQVESARAAHPHG